MNRIAINEVTEESEVTTEHVDNLVQRLRLLGFTDSAGDEAANEIERLQALIDEAAKYWIMLHPGVAWEGAIDSAMEAAVGEIRMLRLKLAKNVVDFIDEVLDAAADTS